MNHRYFDVAHLNAPYKTRALEGLSGDRAYRSTADLNAQYDSVPLQGLGGGILSAGPTGSLGAVTASYPWRSYSADTVALQKAMNEALKAHGYCPVDPDGKLGPATCGAVKAMLDLTGQTDQSPPSTCQSFTAPTKGPCGGGSSPPVSPAQPAKTTPLVKASGFDSGTVWIIVGGVVAVGAIGASLYFTRKGR